MVWRSWKTIFLKLLVHVRLTHEQKKQDVSRALSEPAIKQRERERVLALTNSFERVCGRLWSAMCGAWIVHKFIISWNWTRERISDRPDSGPCRCNGFTSNSKTISHRRLLCPVSLSCLHIAEFSLRHIFSLSFIERPSFNYKSCFNIFERCLLVPVKLFFFHHSCRELSRTFLHVCQKPKISILSIRTATAMNRSQFLPRLGHGVYVSASSAFSMSDHVQSDTKDLSVGHLSESVAWGRRRRR